MTALAVVEDLDVFEEGRLGLAPGSEPSSMHEFRLKGAEEAFHRRVIQAIALSAHRRLQAVCLEHLAVATAGVLNAADALLFVKRRCGSG